MWYYHTMRIWTKGFKPCSAGHVVYYGDNIAKTKKELSIITKTEHCYGTTA